MCKRGGGGESRRERNRVGGTGNRGLSFVAAPSKSHKIIICKREFISKNIYGLLGLQERSRNLYIYVCVGSVGRCVCVCVRLCLHACVCA